MLFLYIHQLQFIIHKVKQGRPTPTKLSNAMGSMYAAVIFIGLQNSASVQPVVDVERTVFYRELAAGMYSALAYAFSQVTRSLMLYICRLFYICNVFLCPLLVKFLLLLQAIVEIPYIFSQTVLYGVLVYAMISFQWTAAKIFWYLFFMFFTYSGMIAVSLTPNQNFSMILPEYFQHHGTSFRVL